MTFVCGAEPLTVEVKNQKKRLEIIQIWSSQWERTAKLTRTEGRRDCPHVPLFPLTPFKPNIWHQSGAESQYFAQLSKFLSLYGITKMCEGMKVRFVY